MSTNSGRNHQELTNNLVKNGMLSTPQIIKAWLKCDRKYFNPLRDVNIYEDRPFPIGAEATISAPNVHTVGVQSVSDNLFGTQTDPQTGQESIPQRSILDVASGSGYMTALFGTICKDELKNGSKVLGIDIHQSLVNQSIKNVQKFDPSLLDDGIISFQRHDAFRPAAPFPGAPFDVIHGGCSIQFVPLSSLSMLKMGGSMIMPIQTSAQDQNFFHIIRKHLPYDQIPTGSPFAHIKNDTDFFNTATSIQNAKVKDQKNHQLQNDFINTFFTHKNLFGVRYLMALTDDEAPQHIAAWDVPH